MAYASRYWTLIQLDPAGGYVTREIPAAQLFLCRQFPELIHQTAVETAQDKLIQTRLVEFLGNTALASAECLWVEKCLRCYISHQILQVCVDLQNKFGENHGFTLNDLLGLVLDDVDLDQSILRQSASESSKRARQMQAAYVPLAARILRSFDPKFASLSTWASMLTRQHNELNDFLLKYGVFLQSNWSLLNETAVDALQRILTETFHLPAIDIEKACTVLSSYHAVYRCDRRGQRGRCQLPTEEQLNRILQLSKLPISPRALLNDLITLADYLRQHRLLSRGNVLPSVSIHDPDVGTAIEQTISQEQETDLQDNPTTEANGPLMLAVTRWLDQAIGATIEQRCTYLQKKSPSKAAKYVAVLRAYCCDQKSMKEIATEVGLKAQYEVTRLLKLDDFLDDIRCNLLKKIKEEILSVTQNEEIHSYYMSPEKLQDLDEEKLAPLIVKPRSNSSSNTLESSLFIQRLCTVIQNLKS
jgi:hypothetical protein